MTKGTNNNNNNNHSRNKSGRSSSTGKSSNTNTTRSSTGKGTRQKSPVAMERLMTKSSKKYKKGSSSNYKYKYSDNYKELLYKSVVIIIAFVFGTVAFPTLSNTDAGNAVYKLVHNVVPTIYMNIGMGAVSMDMGMGMGGGSPSASSFSVPMAHKSTRPVPFPSRAAGGNGSGNGNSGRIFAQARSADADGNGDIISLGSDFTVDKDSNSNGHSAATTAMPSASTRTKYNHNNSNNGYDSTYDDEMSMYNYNYYYYDSSTQAFYLHEQFASFMDHPTYSSAAASAVMETTSSSVSSSSSSTNSNTIATTPFQKALSLSGRYQPSLCSDGHTYGFSDLTTLRNAIHELNDAYSHAVHRWEHYNNALSEYEMIKFLHQQQTENSGTTDMDMDMDIAIESPPPLPEHLSAILEVEPDPFVICPHATLRAPLGRHHMTLNINAEDVVVECDSCVIDTPGTHFSFGPYAKNVLIKGITMMGATESSIVFRYDGADASFEDCYWVNNDSVGMHGAVADMNSTSVVKFYRCEISDVKQSSSPRAGMHGAGNAATSSLTLRR